MRTYELEEELEGLIAERKSVEMMTENEACVYLNTDSKAEALRAIDEEITYWQGLLDRAREEVDEEEESDSWHMAQYFHFEDMRLARINK
jgi:hypothetical protein